MRGMLEPALSLVNATVSAASAGVAVLASNATSASVNATSLVAARGATGLAASLLDTSTMEYLIVIAALVILLLDVTDFKSDALVPLLVPLIFLNMPPALFDFLRGDVGLWCAFFIILTVLYTPPAYIPPPTNMWSALLLLHIVAPSWIVDLRGDLLGVFISFVIGVVLLTQHVRSPAVEYGPDGMRIQTKSQPVTLALLVVAIVPIIIFVASVVL